MATQAERPEPIIDAEIINDYSLAKELERIIAPLSSLKLTVVLFALSIALILFGTLAQTTLDMWEVMTQYFYPWVALVPISVLFPPAWFPNIETSQMTAVFALLTIATTAVVAAISYQVTKSRLLGQIAAAVVVAIGIVTLLTGAMRGAFYFPGGALIGSALFVNLLAAHAVRFKVKARGLRLAIGLLATLAGIGFTWLIIASGHNQEGLGATLDEETSARLWQIVVWSVVALAFCGTVAATVLALGNHWRKIEFWVFAMVVGLIDCLALVLLISGGNPYLDPSGMRILWQLIQGTLAGVVLLGGCLLLFHKRGGIALIHAGVGLLMFGQLYVSQFDVEQQMDIAEGRTVNYAQDIRSVELAVVDRNAADRPERDVVVAVPMSKNGAETEFLRNKKIQHDDLPFDIEIVKYFKNSNVEQAKPGDDNPATAGKHPTLIAREATPVSGTDSGGGVNQASAYVRFNKKGKGAGAAENLGTYLLSQIMLLQGGGMDTIDFEQLVEVDGKPYEVALRFKRTYKPYFVTLADVRKDDYPGTSTPRNYSSDIFLVDTNRNVDRAVHIWMNNPLRCAGETFYQSSWQVDHRGREHTVLSIVKNRGWMIPYVACMLVVVGLLAHFTIVLLRFLYRLIVRPPVAAAEPQPQDKGKKKRRAQPEKAPGPPLVATLALSLLALLVGAGYLMRVSKPPQRATDEIQYEECGKLPIIYEGRVKPFDTLARNSLRVLSNREEFRDENGDRQPAIRWLLDVIAGTEGAEKHKVFRIDNPEVLSTLKLDRRPGNLYSVEDLRGEIVELEKQIQKARERAKEEGAGKLNTFEKKLIELDGRIRKFTLLGEAFLRPNLPPLPTQEEFEKDPEAAQQQAAQFRNAFTAFFRRISALQPPLAVPVKSPSPETQDESGEVQWEPYSKAWAMGFVQARLGGDVPPALASLDKVLVSYHDYRQALDDAKILREKEKNLEARKREDAAAASVKSFNQAVIEYRQQLAKAEYPQLENSRADFEAYFNHVAPFYRCSALYVIAFVLTAIGWLAGAFRWNRPFLWAAFSLIVLTFLVHTLALGARIYISGRPPVTNLYSSAVFIGWACVLMGIGLELIFRIGVGNAVAAVSGFSTLLIAHFLAGDGDTFVVLQAVLDTQFWLATHVVSITIGYAATFVASLLGAIFILAGLFTPALVVPVGKWNIGKILGMMIYGVMCFAIFFSFFGTVLGGLWADDSWGRFWGWDPKENGALIIVLWNALVLHARWGGMVKERGLAVLAVAGGIMTSWSWFGVNELGVGLHSYGFTEGVLLALGTFVASQLLLIGAGWLLLPWATRYWANLIRGPQS